MCWAYMIFFPIFISRGCVALIILRNPPRPFNHIYKAPRLLHDLVGLHIQVAQEN